MTTNQIAAKILEFRRASGLLMPGKLHADIGPDAIGEALNRRWIIADEDTGYLMITTEQTRIAEMQELAATVEEDKGAEKAGSTQESVGPRDFALNHAQRRLHEAAAYGSGQPAAPAQAATPATPATSQVSATSNPSPTSNPSNSALQVGEDVTIAEEGKAYQAKVKAVNSDGTYELSFGTQRPVTQRPYRKEEVQRSQAMA
jgi:hypothetical protein